MSGADHWLHGFNVEVWFEGDRCEALIICRNLAIARGVQAVVEDKPAGGS